MRKLAIFTAAFAVAAAVYVYALQGVPVLWIAGGCLLLVPVAWKFGFRRCGIVLLGLSAGLILSFAHGQVWITPLQQHYETEQSLTVTLTEQPVPSPYGAYGTGTVPIDGKTYEALLYSDASLLDARAGDRVTAVMQLKSAETDTHYLQAKGTMLRLYAKSDLRIDTGEAGLPMRIRLWLQTRIHALYDGEAAGLVQALLTGDRSAMADTTEHDLSVAGLSHAVAVSGLHVSILLSVIAFLCGRNARITALLGIPLAVLFALMTGASPSACRAAVMQVLMLTAPLLRREQDSATSLSAAALLLLVQNPWVVANVGFQLSFGSVAGLLLFSAPIQQRILALREKPGRILRFFASGISASLGASALTIPLMLVYFDCISIAAVFSNLLLLWAISLILTLGLLSCVVGLLAVPVGWLASGVLTACRWIASFPYAAAYPQNMPLLVWTVLAYGVVYWLLLRKKGSARLPLLCLTAAFLGCVLWGRWNLLHGAPVFRVLDVGQGQCTLLHSDDFTAVLDCGGEDAGTTAIRTLHSGGQTHVDALVLTHFDSDHANGAVQLLHSMEVDLVLLPDVSDESGMRQRIEDAAHDAGSRVMAVSELTEVTFSDGKLTIYPPLSAENDNNCGISILATASEYDILVTGDLDRFMEMRLLSRWELPQVDVLMAGHHGAADSTSEALLELVDPKVVAISVGADNPYGHPTRETLDRIEQSGAAVFRTDEDGTIVLRK